MRTLQMQDSLRATKVARVIDAGAVNTSDPLKMSTGAFVVNASLRTLGELAIVVAIFAAAVAACYGWYFFTVWIDPMRTMSGVAFVAPMAIVSTVASVYALARTFRFLMALEAQVSARRAHR